MKRVQLAFKQMPNPSNPKKKVDPWSVLYTLSMGPKTALVQSVNSMC